MILIGLEGYVNLDVLHKVDSSIMLLFIYAKAVSVTQM